AGPIDGAGVAAHGGQQFGGADAFERSAGEGLCARTEPPGEAASLTGAGDVGSTGAGAGGAANRCGAGGGGEFLAGGGAGAEEGPVSDGPDAGAGGGAPDPGPGEADGVDAESGRAD